MSEYYVAGVTERTDRERFPFGRNWTSFLGVLDDARIVEAERSLTAMVGDRIGGSTFLDVGSGSGLFSLAAMRLGARRVHSFDADQDSVACTKELRRRYFPTAEHWTVDHASVLDAGYLQRLGTWDIVYSWGVLHHTGDMWKALDLVAGLVAPTGRLFIAIYNDQGPLSRFWASVKRTYNKGPIRRVILSGVFGTWWVVRGAGIDLVRLKNPLTRYRTYRTSRGMSVVHDWRDWLGGYPFEVATPAAVLDFCRARGFSLIKLKTCGGRIGCNEYVFERGS